MNLTINTSRNNQKGFGNKGQAVTQYDKRFVTLDKSAKTQRHYLGDENSHLIKLASDQKIDGGSQL